MSNPLCKDLPRYTRSSSLGVKIQALYFGDENIKWWCICTDYEKFLGKIIMSCIRESILTQKRDEVISFIYTSIIIALTSI